MLSQESLLLKASGIVGKEHVLEAPLQDYVIDDITPRLFASPASLEQISALVTAANQERLSVVPRGSGTKIDLGGIPEKIDIIISTLRVNRVVEYEPADLTCTVEAGIKLSELQKILGAKHQFLPIDPPYASRATIGGIIAANSSGPRRLLYGSPRDLVIGIKVILPTGETVKSGGKVVKNVAGYDLKKLYIGSLGTLGVIGQLTFKVYPLPDTEATVAGAFDSPDKAAAAVARIMDSFLQPTALEIIDPTAADTVLPSRGGSETYWLAACFSGVPSAVKRQLVETEDLYRKMDVGEVRVLEGEEGQAIWRNVSDFRDLMKARTRFLVGMKANLPPSKVGHFIGHARATARQESMKISSFGHAGSGIVYIYLLFEDLQETSLASVHRVVTRLRDMASNLEGGLLIESAPVPVKEKVSVWGPTRSDFTVMRSIKSAFDPNRIMNPGRFLGGL